MIFWWHQPSVQVMMRTWKSVSQEQVGQPWQKKDGREGLFQLQVTLLLAKTVDKMYRPQAAVISFTFSTLPFQIHVSAAQLSYAHLHVAAHSSINSSCMLAFKSISVTH